MNESDKHLSEIPKDEMDLRRVLLCEGLAYLGLIEMKGLQYYWC